MRDIGSFLADLASITRVRLLPYHLAHSKFEAVGMADPVGDIEVPTRQQMKMAEDIMTGFGLRTLVPGR